MGARAERLAKLLRRTQPEAIAMQLDTKSPGLLGEAQMSVMVGCVYASCVSVSVCVHLCVYARVRVYVFVCIYLYIYIYIYIYITDMHAYTSSYTPAWNPQGCLGRCRLES